MSLEFISIQNNHPTETQEIVKETEINSQRKNRKTLYNKNEKFNEYNPWKNTLNISWSRRTQWQNNNNNTNDNKNNSVEIFNSRHNQTKQRNNNLKERSFIRWTKKWKGLRELRDQNASEHSLQGSPRRTREIERERQFI